MDAGDKWKTACHEAGHSIVAVRLGVTFERVTVGPRDDDGEVFVLGNPIDDPSDDWTREDIRNYQVFYAAGGAAERLLFLSEREYGIRGDRQNHETLEALLLTSRTDGFECDTKSAIQLLTIDKVKNVAAELVRLGQLTFEEVAKIIGSPLPWD